MEHIKPTKQSPCVTCTRVQNPNNCENKLCKSWQQWFLARWAEIHAYGQLNLQSSGSTAVARAIVGGAKNKASLQSNDNPCNSCICERDMCAEPCRTKRAWLQEQEEERR